MSKYYNVNGLKVRVSDHEANTSLNGGNDIYLYIKSADNRLLSVETQIECVCEKRNMKFEDFKEIVNDWKDGTYNINSMSIKTEETDENESSSNLVVTYAKLNTANDNRDVLKDFVLTHRFGKESREEIKAISLATGISQSFIKKHFNIR